MPDRIEKIGKSKIQHGKENNRIYLMKLHREDVLSIIPKLEALRAEKNYGKIFAKIPLWAVRHFSQAGYIREAFVPGFYKGKTGVYFMAKFFKKRQNLDDKNCKEILNVLGMAKSAQTKNIKLPESFSLVKLETKDAEKLSKLYKTVFKSYPFPIFDPAYLRQTMLDKIFYFGLFSGKKLIAASSAETDREALNVEMTDFAADPDFRGNGYASILLEKMEKYVKQKDYKLAYTIARSISPGMNITFARNGYTFSGILKNNTQIGGNIECMNVWYKNLKI
ncbi:putative beta-lysine N-acetyltransferase [candidate division KSB1 bacterium]|nr:putative beta-lysine N-acetyltransferase [candidate division KSB1 bacterium]